MNAYDDPTYFPLYPVARQTDGEAALWRRLDELARHIVNLQQRINGQQTEINRLRETLDRMTSKTPTPVMDARQKATPRAEPAPARPNGSGTRPETGEKPKTVAWEVTDGGPMT